MSNFNIKKDDLNEFMTLYKDWIDLMWSILETWKTQTLEKKKWMIIDVPFFLLFIPISLLIISIGFIICGLGVIVMFMYLIPRKLTYRKDLP